MNINSKDYWDSRFSSDWDMNSGREQTLYFCDLTMKNLPEWFHQILIEGVTFADVGCAEGDCTHFFASSYSKSSFTGIDFSDEAILKAKKLFPSVSFISSDIMDINETYDVVYSSNTLEHFHEPFKILEKLFEISNKYVVLLLPFQERERFKEHFYTFEYKDFKIKHDNFLLVYSKEIDCSLVPNIFWSGKQILLIYKRESFEDGVSPTLADYLGELPMSLDNLKKLEQYYLDKVRDYENVTEYLKSNMSKALEQNNTLLKLLRERDIYVEKLNRELNKKLEVINEQDKCIEEQNKYIEEQKRLSSEQFSEQLKLGESIDHYKRQEQWLLTQNYQKEIELKNIYNSGFWKLATKYYKLRDLPGPRHLYKSSKIIKEHGFRAFWGILGLKVKRLIKDRGHDKDSKLALLNLYSHINSLYKDNGSGGLAIIPSAFPFDELYNQRTINLAKYLSSRNFIVFYVSWQWNRKETSPQAFEEVYPNVYSIPMYPFIDNVEALSIFDNSISNRIAFYNTPSSEYCRIISAIRKNKFSIVYDVMDEWEEFSNVGQAPWYQREYEELLILQADNVITVSQPLKDKFSGLRNDIEVIGNGYFSELLGEGDIANKKRNKKGIIHVGYFGHLTESWFDWDLIFEVLSDPNIQLHIIGYGASETTIKKLKKMSNVKLYGKIKPQDLHKYVEKWHVGVIPFTKSKLSQAVDPIKIYEYLYFGLPTIATGIEHLENYPNVIVCPNDATAVVEGIKRSYQLVVDGEKSNNHDTELNKFLEETSWNSRFDKLLEVVRDNDTFVRMYK